MFATVANGGEMFATKNSRLFEVDDVKISLPNGADLRNITSFINNLDSADPSKLEFEMHDRWVFVHPAVLALTACAA
jgi:hypothetical protein